MPKQAFFNLPLEKQQELIKAAKKEFSCQLLAEASINQIIKDIQMPRGTFYLYFDNKYELYHYIVKDYMDSLDTKMKELLIKHKGDIIATFIDLYDYLLNNCFKGYETLLKNIFLNMNYNIQNAVLPKPDKDVIHKFFQTLTELINMNQLNVQNPDDILDILFILKSLLFHSISETFLPGVDVMYVKKRYINKLELIKNGIYRKEPLC